MADQGDIGRHWTHSLRMPPVSSGVIHICLVPEFGSEPPGREHAWHCLLMSCIPCTPYDGFDRCIDVGMRHYRFPDGRHLPIFATRTISAGSRYPTRVLA
jgi:hypothetical protein